MNYSYIMLLSLLNLLLCLIGCQSSKILILPVYQKSHVSSLLAIADELEARGHEVHIVGYEGLHGISLESTRNGSNVKQFQMRLKEFGGVSYDANKLMEQMSSQFVNNKEDEKQMVETVKASPYNVCNNLPSFTDESFENLANEHFDLAIVDGTLFSMCLYLIPHRLDIPWITYTDYLDPWLVRLPWLPSFVPYHFTTFTERMTFTKRLKNTLVVSYVHLFGTKIVVAEDVMTSYRQYGPITSLDELARRSRLFLVTSHVILDYPKPRMPNVVEVGGLTTAEPKPLPTDIQEFLDGAEKGVLLVSFGTMLSTLPQHIAEKFSSAFSRLDGFRVVWRLGNTTKMKLPSNVMTSAWIPQNDVLAHPMTKLFITHCGNNGQFEAVYNKVPMIGFPFFGDQSYNAVRLQYKGLGLMMDLHDFTSDQLLHNIQHIISDPTYAARVSRASEIFKSSSRERPAERAADAVEHVCKYGGDDLHSAGNDLYLYQYLMLDVLASLVSIMTMSVVIVYKISRLVYVKISLCSISPRKVGFAEDYKKKK